MKLYGFAGSPRTWKVRALASHLGIPLEFEHLDFANGENRTPEYLALNPTGRTPTLVDDDFVLWESDAIMQYLACKKPNFMARRLPHARRYHALAELAERPLGQRRLRTAPLSKFR